MFTIRKSILTVALALVAFPAAASAIPVNDDDEPDAPFNAVPIARFTITPNPAVASTPLVIAQARRAPGDFFGNGDLVKFDGSASSDPDGAIEKYEWDTDGNGTYCLLYTSPSPRDGLLSRMPSSA